MSSLWRMRLASLPNISSRRFFSRMTCCDFWGFDQRLGSEACFSISANRGRRLPASKILPKFANFVFQGRIFFFKLFDHDVVLFEIALAERVSARCHSAGSEGAWFFPWPVNTEIPRRFAPRNDKRGHPTFTYERSTA